MNGQTVDLPSVAALGTGALDRPSTPTLALFGTTIFFGAFLLFLVEPMIAKMVLPVLGGTPMVWNTCVLFFQVTLLAGYAYAHGAGVLLRPRRHAAIYAIILLAPLLTLPFALRGAGTPPTGNPIGWLFAVLALSIGLPFFALAVSSSLLQKLFSATSHQSAKDPYFLYSASNVGSLLALVAYPLVVEPAWRLEEQASGWAAGYSIFAVCALACIVTALRRTDGSAVTAAAEAAEHLTWSRRGKWLILAFIPSSLTLGVTTYLTTDIAAVPLLWVVPLGLYLFTFIVAFSSRPGSWRAVVDLRLPMLVVSLIAFLMMHVVGPAMIVVPVHLIAFTFGALLCHFDLAADRPRASHLTEFYFWIAAGGMLGGVFNTLIAPLLFPTVVEYPLVLLLLCLFRTGTVRSESETRDTLDVLVPIGIGGLTVALILSAHYLGITSRWAMFLPAALVLSQGKRSKRFAASAAALLVAGSFTPYANGDGATLYRERTFFGIYRINIDRTGQYRALYHGTTLHGLQALDPGRRNESLTYFDRTGPIGQVFAEVPVASSTAEVAIIGLGVGTLATYAGPDQHWTFYEIDPAVERISRSPEYFTFLAGCGDRCRVVLGDARLSLARSASKRFGVIVLDAFSSDSIPVHLITSEAVSLYLSRLLPHGILAFHISNRHLTLGPIVGQLAAAHGLTALQQINWVGNDVQPDGRASSIWVVLARSAADLGPLTTDSRWVPLKPSRTTPLWTDNFSNILGVFSAFN